MVDLAGLEPASAAYPFDASFTSLVNIYWTLTSWQNCFCSVSSVKSLLLLDHDVSVSYRASEQTRDRLCCQCERLLSSIEVNHVVVFFTCCYKQLLDGVITVAI